VAVTAGIMRLLNSDELEAVLSHELSHIKNRDTLISTVAATLAGALSQLANMAMWGMMFGGRSRNDRDSGSNPLMGLVGMILAPLAAAMIQMAISRSREFMADESGATVCGKPLALASALQKIESWKKEIPLQSGSPATAHLFIINPFSGQGLASLFSTHPPTAERVKRLEEMAYKGVLPPHH
jgi:heat shock protein HtpX